MNYKITNHKSQIPNSNAGFTLMEIVVSTAVFTTVLVAMMSVFILTLKLNRRSDALRQASQGARNFVEFLVKEVRNGHIDYSVQNGTIVQSSVAPCPAPTGGANSQVYDQINTNNIAWDWTLGLVNIDGERECFYWSQVNGDGTKPAGNNFSPFNSLYFKKELVSQPQKLNPTNISIDFLHFYVRPNRDPYATPTPKIQPSVTIVMQFTAQLPTGEKVIIPYQTTISTNNYDIPAN